MVQEIEISKLNPAPYNPRVDLQPGMPEYESLKNGILQFGNVEPIVVNERNMAVIGGHQRLKVLEELGYETAPCSLVNLSEDDEKTLNIALNKISGTWDNEKLEALISELDYELTTLTGFSAAEIANLMASDEDLYAGEEYGDWEEEFDTSEDGYEPEDDYAGSYVLTLKFDSWEDAHEWGEKEGYADKIRQHTKSAVLRAEENGEEE